MSSVTTSSTTSVYSPKRVSGQSTRPAETLPSANETPPSTTESQPRRLSFFQTIRAIYKQLKAEDDASRQVFKGLALKHGPDLALPGFFAIPVVGWVAGIIAMPFMGWLERKGQKIIDEQSPALKERKDKPLYHYLKLQNLWEGSTKQQDKTPKPGKVLNPNKNKDTASRMARTWNKLVNTLFAHKDTDVAPALKRTLNFSLDENKNPNGNTFARLKRFLEAREGLQEKWYYKVFLRPFDWLYKKLPLPKLIKGLALTPKLAVLALFYWTGAKPKQ